MTMSPEERAAHCRRIASFGGRAIVERHGTAHMSAIGKRGFAQAIQSIGSERLAAIISHDFEAEYGRKPDAGAMKRREQQARERVRQQCRRLYKDLTCDWTEAGQRCGIRALLPEPLSGERLQGRGRGDRFAA